MIPALIWFVVVGISAIAGIGGIALGIWKRDWPRPARAIAIILGAVVALPAVYELLVMAYVATCNPTASCL